MVNSEKIIFPTISIFMYISQKKNCFFSQIRRLYDTNLAESANSGGANRIRLKNVTVNHPGSHTHWQSWSAHLNIAEDIVHVLLCTVPCTYSHSAFNYATVPYTIVHFSIYRVMKYTLPYRYQCRQTLIKQINGRKSLCWYDALRQLSATFRF